MICTLLMIYILPGKGPIVAKTVKKVACPTLTGLCIYAPLWGIIKYDPCIGKALNTRKWQQLQTTSRQEIFFFVLSVTQAHRELDQVLWAPRQAPRASGNILWGGSWTVTTSHPTQTACSSAASWPLSPQSMWRVQPRQQLQPTAFLRPKPGLNGHQEYKGIKQGRAPPIWDLKHCNVNRDLLSSRFSFLSSSPLHLHTPPTTNILPFPSVCRCR